ncbi:MAG: hypothetical protein H7Y37_01500 [Anaerolineae bacterium]|nr:hypothetical protein [Gloeobacterales cyanobacterium ES-bin-313]
MRLQQLFLLSAVFCVSLSAAPVFAKSCAPLKPVGNPEGANLKAANSISKSISPASVGVAKDNWNTDFEIPNSIKFSSYTVLLTPDSDGQYDVVSYLKYANGKAQTAFEKKGVSLGKGKTLEFTVSPESVTTSPYQVNVLFGGTLSTGKSYTLKVLGCK